MLPNSTGFKAINLKTSGMGTGLIAAFIRDNIDPSLNATLDQSRGVALVNTTDNNNSTYTKTFYSANNGSNLPYVSISYYTAVTGVSVSPTSATLDIGETKQLTATVSPSNATNKTVTWTSSKTSVATVSSSGLVTAKDFGNATITATTSDGNYAATCSIYVRPASATTLTFNNNQDGNITSGGTIWYKFVPTETKAYDFLSMKYDEETASIDVDATLYDTSTAIAFDTDSGTDDNFLICQQLTAGTTYYLKVTCSSSATGGAYKVLVRDNYGAVLPYVETTGNIQNCFGYAINQNMYITTPECFDELNSDTKRKTNKDIEKNDTSETYFVTVKEFIDTNNEFDYTATRIESKDAFVDEDSYRVAMRIIHSGTYGTIVVNDSDFHFLRQTNDGRWAWKSGAASTSIQSINPDINCEGWGVDYGLYYDGPTVYFSLRYK